MTYDEKVHRNTKRKGQTLVEFALTLPILLGLIFGIIEFGRAFQAWITLENAAREAARYTTTGQYDMVKYDLWELFPCTLEDNNEFEILRDRVLRGDETLVTYQQNPPVKIFTDNGDLTPQTLFATYYDGTNCHPGEPDDFERRKDIVRLASIYDVARRAATGLNLEASIQDGTLYPLFEQLAHRWEINSERSQHAGYFDVLVCSTRSNLREDSTYIHSGSTSRFHMVFDVTDLPNSTTVQPSRQYWNDFNPPYCLLNELQPVDGTVINNAGMPWIDAGGPGDRITVVVTLNHMLLTPIFDYKFITMQARRSGVNETFRTSRALNAVQGSAPTGGFPDRDPGLTQPTEEPTDPPTEEPTTPPPTEETTPDPTPTEEIVPVPPFDCEAITIGGINFNQNSLNISIHNANARSAVLQSAHIEWNVPSSPDMRLESSELNGQRHWASNLQLPAKTSVAWLSNPNAPLAERNQWNGAPRHILGTETTDNEYTVSNYRATFINVNASSFNPINISNFGGTQLLIYSPSDGMSCYLHLLQDYPTPDPEEETPENPTEEPTPERPDCSQNLLSVKFERFDTMGVVVLRVENNRDVPSPLLGVDIRWFDHDPAPPYQGRESKIPGVNALGQVYLNQIRVGPLSSTPFSGTVTVWNGATDHRSSPTVNHPNLRTHGTWLTNYNFPPHSVSRVYLDFDGSKAVGRLDSQDVRMEDWMIDGDLWIDCLLYDGSLEGNGNIHNDYTSFNEPPPPTPTPEPPPPDPDPQILVRQGWDQGPTVPHQGSYRFDDYQRQANNMWGTSRDFYIFNVGPYGDLIRNGAIKISGDTNNFVLSEASWPNVRPGGNARFNIRCKGDRVGTYKIKVEIGSNATNISNYTFDVECTVKDSPPNITVENRRNQNSTVGKNSQFWLPEVTVGQESTAALRIRNIGTSSNPLTSNDQAIRFVGDNEDKFYFISGANWSNLSSDQSHNFDFGCRTSEAGEFKTRVVIANNSGDNNPYSFEIRCKVNPVHVQTEEPTREPTDDSPPPGDGDYDDTGGGH